MNRLASVFTFLALGTSGNWVYKRSGMCARVLARVECSFFPKEESGVVFFPILVHSCASMCIYARVVDGGVTATGVLSRERGNLITVCITLY